MKKNKKPKSTDYFHAESILRDSYGERETLARPGIKIMDIEPKRPHLKFVLLPADTHAKVYKMDPTEVSLKRAKD